MSAGAGCSANRRERSHQPGNNEIGLLVEQMSDLMLHDVTSPPLASRFFGYTLLSGYEIVSQHDSTVPGMYGILNNYPVFSQIDSLPGYDYRLAAVFAMIETASSVTPKGSTPRR